MKTTNYNRNTYSRLKFVSKVNELLTDVADISELLCLLGSDAKYKNKKGA